MNSSIVTEVTILPHREKNSILFGLPSYMQPPCPVLHELWLLDVSVFAIALCDSLCPCPVDEVVKRRLLFQWLCLIYETKTIKIREWENWCLFYVWIILCPLQDFPPNKLNAISFLAGSTRYIGPRSL